MGLALAPGSFTGALATALGGVVLYGIVIGLWSVLQAPREVDAEQAVAHARALEATEQRLASTEDQLQRSQDALARSLDETTVVQNFVTLYDEGDLVDSAFSISLPFPDDAITAAVGLYRDWADRVVSYVHEHRTKYDLKLREAQNVEHAAYRGPQLVGVAGKWFDINEPAEYQIRIRQVRAILREIIDAG